MNAPHLPQGAIFVLMRQCLRFAYGGRFLRRCLRFFSVFAFDGGRPFLRFWRCLRLAAGGRFLRCFAVGGGRACVAGVFLRRCLRFFAVFVFGGGRAGDAGVFAVCVWRRAAVLAAVCGGRPFFAAFCGLRRAAVFCGVLRFAAGCRFLRRFAVSGGRPLFAVSGGRRAVVFCGV